MVPGPAPDAPPPVRNAVNFVNPLHPMIPLSELRRVLEKFSVGLWRHILMVPGPAPDASPPETL